MPEPVSDFVIAYVLGILTAIWVPTRYAMERLEGFGRWGMQKIPYEPPPGKSEEEAMEETDEETGGS